MIVLYSGEHSVYRKEANFDRACDEARRFILSTQLDEYGNSIHDIPDWDRSDCSIEIVFKEYRAICGYTGVEHYYQFTWNAIKNDDED